MILKLEHSFCNEIINSLKVVIFFIKFQVLHNKYATHLQDNKRDSFV